jgi:hypothetical protein
MRIRQGGQVANDFNLERSVVSRVHNDLADQLRTMAIASALTPATMPL